LIGDDSVAIATGSRCGDVGVEEVRRQTGIERPVPLRLNMDPIALEPVVGRAVTLEDGHADAYLF
jgi:hypothetical protein